jgi:hypothetical protein
MSKIIDRSHNRETGELQQFTIIDESGQPQLVKATPENVLLYDPEDDLPFDDGLHGFLSGEKAVVLSDEPEVIVGPTNNEYCYILRVRGSTVETTPNQAEDVLSGIKEAATEDNIQTLTSLYDDIRANQVRRPVVNALYSTFSEQERINRTSRGWLVDEFYLVNWEASMYLRHNDPDEGDYKRGGGSVQQTDRSYEFVQLNLRRDIEPVDVTIQGETYRLTEREMLFLAKVKWLLNRRKHHPDQPFWMYADKWAAVDEKTGEPEPSDDDSDEQPDPDNFNL